MDHTQTPSAMNASHAANLLTLPNEVLLAVIAHVPYSKGKNLTVLKLVNHQLLDLLTNASNIQDLRRLIAKIQYSYCLALRPAMDDPPFGVLDDMDAETEIVNRIFDWMKNLFPAIGDYSNPHNKAHLLHIGLYLFFAISRLGLDVKSEYDTALFLTSLGPPATALMRLTSTAIARCLRELAEQPGRDLQRDILSSPAVFSVIETMLVRGGLHVIDTHISSEAPTSTGNQSWRFFAGVDSTRSSKKGSSRVLIRRAPAGGRSKFIVGRSVNDSLVLDSCQHEGSAVDFAAIYSTYLGIEYETAQLIEIKAEPDGWQFGEDADFFESGMPEFIVADWYKWVAMRFPLILNAVLQRLLEQKPGTSVLKAGGTGFTNAVAARDASPTEEETVYWNLRPHCTLLCMREAMLQQSEH